MRILITGASGFLGSALANSFLEDDIEIFLLLRSNSNTSRLQGDNDKFKIKRFSTKIDIQNIILETKPNIVIHTACNYGRNSESTLEIFEANYIFGLIILDSFKSLGIKVHFINIGTVLNPDISEYAFSKVQFSNFGKYISTETNLDIRFINILLQHIYGPNDDISKFSTYIINSCYFNVNELNLTAGEQIRDFIFIEDAVSAIKTVINKIDQISFNEIEVGSGEEIKIRDFVKSVQKITGSNIKINFGALQYRKNEVMYSVANIKQLNKLGWIPKYSLAQGIEQTIKIQFK